MMVTPPSATEPAPAAGTTPAGDAAIPVDTAAGASTTIAVKETAPAPACAPARPGPELVRLDEYRQDGVFVVRAEWPGLDPNKDVQVTVANGRVQIDVEHGERDEIERNGYRVRELRYGHLARNVPLGDGVAAGSITATYNDGVLEVRIPEQLAPQPTRIPIAAS
jgi:HSP20 family protein